MARKRRVHRYPDEFRNAALARLANETTHAIAKDLDIFPTLIDRWKQEKERPNPPKASKVRHFDNVFKLAAVKRVQAGEKQERVAEDLSIGSSVMSTWMKKFSGKRNAHTLSPKARPKPPPAPRMKNGKKQYYVKVADRAVLAQPQENGGANLMRKVHACVGLLRGIRAKCDNQDPVHLTALLVLATLEGKM
jgi:transposase-like protein